MVRVHLTEGPPTGDPADAASAAQQPDWRTLDELARTALRLARRLREQQDSDDTSAAAATDLGVTDLSTADFSTADFPATDASTRGPLPPARSPEPTQAAQAAANPTPTDPPAPRGSRDSQPTRRSEQ